MPKFEIGQKVFARAYDRHYVNENRNIYIGEVTKVGRKYVHVKLSNSWNTIRFRIDPPRIEDPESGYSPDYILHTSEEAIKDYFFAKDCAIKSEKLMDKVRVNIDKIPDEHLYDVSRKLDQVYNILNELEELAKEYDW